MQPKDRRERRPAVLKIGAKLIVLTGNEWAKTKDITKSKYASDCYYYEQKIRFIKDYPVKKYSKQWAQRQVDKANRKDPEC